MFKTVVGVKVVSHPLKEVNSHQQTNHHHLRVMVHEVEIKISLRMSPGKVIRHRDCRIKHRAAREEAVKRFAKRECHKRRFITIRVEAGEGKQAEKMCNLTTAVR